MRNLLCRVNIFLYVFFWRGVVVKVCRGYFGFEVEEEMMFLRFGLR